MAPRGRPPAAVEHGARPRLLGLAAIPRPAPPASGAAPRRALRPASGEQRPATGRPEPLTRAGSAPASPHTTSASAIAGHSETAARLEVVVQQRASRGQRRAASQRCGSRARSRRARGLPRARRAGRPRRNTAQSTAPRQGQQQHRQLADGCRQLLSRSPAPPASQRPGASCAGTSAPSRAPARASAAESPARMRGRPAAVRPPRRPTPPPARPPRDPLVHVSRSGGACQPVARAKGGQRERRRDCPARRPAPRADDLVARRLRRRRAAALSSSASEIDCITLSELVAAVAAAHGPDEQPQVHLRRRQRAQLGAAVAAVPVAGSDSQLELPASARNCSGDRRSARTSPGSPSERQRRPARARAPTAPAARRRPPGAASPPASCGGGRSRRHERPQRGRSGSARAPSRRGRRTAPAPSRHSGREEDGAGNRPHDPDLAGELGEHGGNPVDAPARAGGQPLADLSLDHRYPEPNLRELLNRAQDEAGRDPVGEVRDHLHRRRLQRAEVEPHRVGPPQRHVLVRRRGRRPRPPAGARRPRPRAGGPRARPDTPTARPGRRRPRARRRTASSSASRAITPRMLESIRKFCPSSRSGRTPKRCSRRRLGWPGADPGGPDAQPNRRAAFCSSAAPSSASSTPRSCARKPTGVATKAGWLRCLRTTWGVRYGASVSTSSRSSGTRARGSRQLAGARVGDVAGEGDPVAALQALVAALGHREAVHHDLHAVGFGGQLLERLAGGRARVDHQRLADLAGERDLGGEGPLLVAVGGVVAVEVQAGLADRQAAVVGRQRTQLGEVGVVEAAGRVRMAADAAYTWGKSSAAASAPGRRPRRYRPSGSASRPPPLGRRRPARRSAARRGRDGCVSRSSLRRGRAALGLGGLHVLGQQRRDLLHPPHMAGAQRRLRQRPLGGLERRQQALGAVGDERPQQHGHRAQRLDQRRAPGRARPARSGSFASVQGACSSTYRLSLRTRCQMRSSAWVNSAPSSWAHSCSTRPSKSSPSAGSSSPSHTTPSR